MSEGTKTDALDVTANDQEMARTAAVSLGIWLLLTMAAVGLLLVAGDAIMNLFV